MKKSVMILLAMGLATGVLAGCGSAETQTSSTAITSEVTSEISSVGSEGSSTVTESNTSEVSSTPSSNTPAVSSTVSSKPVSKPTSGTAVSQPPVVSSKPSKPSSSSAVSSSKPASTATPQQICKAIGTAYGSNYYPDGEMPEEYIYGRFPVDRSLVDTAYGEMSMISVNPDQVVVMKAVSGKGAQLETAMKQARDKYVKEAMVYPKDTAKLNASRVVRSGDYVAFIMAGAVDEVNDDVTTEAAQKFAQDQIAIGVRAFQNAAK